MYNNDNIDINVNFVLAYLCSFLLYCHHIMLINVKLDVIGFKSITFLRLQISLILFLSQETAKTKLSILSFLYSSEFVKNLDCDRFTLYSLKRLALMIPVT